MKTDQLVTLASYEPLPEGSEQYGLEFIRAREVVKLCEAADRVTVGTISELEDGLALRLETFHHKQVDPVKLEPTEFSGWLSRRMSEGNDVTGETAAGGHVLEALAADAPVVNLVNSICIDAIRKRASDIHIEALSNGVRVRYRIDGVLATVRLLDSSRFRAVASRIKVMAGLNIMERRKPQDGRTTVNLAGLALDMRISCVPTAGGGESIVLRLFNASDSLFTLDELGFGENILSSMRRLLQSPHGLILVTGPTGSGKSTTLNAMIRSIAGDELKIITIEDPVEYLIDGVDQIQTNEKIGLTFDLLLRRVLRQDPDVILVGEIRDRETAELCVRAALTGHLVLSTLHTNDAAASIERLRDLDVEPYLIAAVLRGVVAQRLIRRLCPACRVKTQVNPARAELFRAAGVESEYEYEASGCHACGGIGYAGRFAVAEFFACNAETAKMISLNSATESVREALRRRGMESLASVALKRAAAGFTSLSELERAGAL